MTSDANVASPLAAPEPPEYDPFAAIYNRWMAEDFCRRAMPVVNKLLLNNLPSNAHILDICCGSGQMARALTERGFRVTGVDASPQMISCARKNAPAARFVHADARHFGAAIPRDGIAPEPTLSLSGCHHSPFDAAISTFNSLAHFSTVSDLAAVFTAVRLSLQPRAPFLFDISMEEAYSTKWRGSFALLSYDLACIVRPTYDVTRRLGTNRITIFTLETQNSKLETAPCYRRCDFTITQKCHSESDLRASLQHSGFNDVCTFDAERDLVMTGENGRMFFLCS